MTRSRVFVTVLWSAAAACGRYGFEDSVTARDSAPAPTAPVATFAASATTTSTCGAQDASLAFPITNAGQADLVISAASATGQFAIATALPLTVPAGASAELRVMPPAAVIGTDRGGDAKTGVLAFTTNEPGAPTHTVALASTVVGANVGIYFPLSPSIALTGTSGTSSACPGGGEIEIANTGNTDVTVALAAPTGFAYSGYTGGTLHAGDSLSTFVRAFTSGACAASGSAVYVVTGPECSTASLAIALTLNITGSSSCSCS